MKKLIATAAVLAFASVRADSDTIAFYPFCDGSASASAVGTVTNAVDAENYAGTVISKGTNPTIVFDADAPGSYIYESGQASAAILSESPQSLNIGSGAASESSATITFSGVAEELSNHHDAGFTVEYCFRLSSENDIPNLACTFELKCGYTYEDTVYPLLVYLPCKDAYTIRYGLNTYASSAIGGFYGKIELGAAISSKLTYPLNDDRWHHFAVVEKKTSSGHSILFYLDRILLKTHDLPDTVSCNAMASGGALKLARDGVAGKFACVRCTKRALEPEEFLVASERKPCGFDSDVLGFYPFDDLADGESAAGRTVFNAAQPMLSPCTVTTNSSSSVAEFSSEGPAKYVFVGEEYGATPCYTNPCSVFLSSSQADDSGTLIFDRLGTELSKCHENGHTVEWFFRFTDDNFLASSSSASYYCRAGYLLGGTVKPNCLYLPFRMDYSEGRQFRFSLGYYSDRCLTKDLDYQPTDGLWHHIAIVERTESASTNLELYVDYALQGSVVVDGFQEESDDRDLELVRNALHGKFSCLKVTKRALSTSEFLRVSNIETYWPLTLSHLTMDGDAGSAAASELASSAVSFASSNSLVYSAQDCAGAFSISGKEDDNPVYSTSHQYNSSKVHGEGNPRYNFGSIYVESTGTGDTGFRAAPNLRMSIPSTHELPSDFTFEGFFRFDKSSWASSAGEYVVARPRLSLMSRKLSSGYSWKLGFVDAIGKTSHRLQLYAYGDDDTASESLSSTSPFCDDTWHHIAVTHDASENRLVVYCDYKPVMTNNLGTALKCSSSGYLAIGDGTSVNDNNFHGYVDEVRYSAACLAPDDFLLQEYVPLGMQ
ncbi:MAG: LamG domain-containing protein, partial [Kiritimatiellae bacterium]|nr:LamG domain-containing protein [Kiritimatiellia bacterium]